MNVQIHRVTKEQALRHLRLSGIVAGNVNAMQQDLDNPTQIPRHASSLMRASLAGNARLAEMLLKAGADALTSNTIDRAEHHFNSIYMAIVCNHIEILKLLMKYAGPNALKSQSCF